ncbi:MAG: hypothetical protein ABGW77_02940 [Campylobacterales bacterium]
MGEPVPFWLIVATVGVLVGISVGIYLWLEGLKKGGGENSNSEGVEKNG